MRWQESLKRHDVLVRQGRAILFDRISLLKSVKDDPGYIKAMTKEGKDPAFEIERRVADVTLDGCQFTELVQMLKLYPSREQWETGDLRGMLQVVRGSMESLGKRKKGGEAGDRNRRLSWKDKYLELERKYQELETKYKELRSVLRGKTA